jgi:putative redox protein
MVICEDEPDRYRVAVSNGQHTMIADTTESHGGTGSGIRPHELLEAAFGACLNMAIRMRADKMVIPLTKVTTQVLADRTQPGSTVFKYTIILDGDLTEQQRQELRQVAAECPVRKTLSNTLTFVESI